ncbi:hypothetical protein KIPB_014217, partial [Kipferlia bialata]
FGLFLSNFFKSTQIASICMYVLVGCITLVAVGTSAFVGTDEWYWHITPAMAFVTQIRILIEDVDTLSKFMGGTGGELFRSMLVQGCVLFVLTLYADEVIPRATQAKAKHPLFFLGPLMFWRKTGLDVKIEHQSPDPETGFPGGPRAMPPVQIPLRPVKGKRKMKDSVR